MPGTRLCKENEDRLKALGLGLDASGRQDLSKSGNKTGPGEIFRELRHAVQRISNAVTIERRHDAALEIFALLFPKSAEVRSDGGEKAECVAKAETKVDLSEAAGSEYSKMVNIIADATLCVSDTQDMNKESLIGEVGLSSISLLNRLHTFKMARSSLARITAYTNGSRPWVTNSAAILATGLLSYQLSENEVEAFVTDTVLQGFVRSALGCGSTTHTTPPEIDNGLQTAVRPPELPFGQYGRRLQAIGCIEWSLSASKDSLVAKHWNSYVPALLTLAEDPSASIRTSSMGLYSSFLSKCPHRKLHATGLDRVFELALLPSLLFLPSLTPEQESASLLRATYSVLLELSKTYEERDEPGRCRLLDVIIREGIVNGHRLAGENMRITEVFMDSISHAVNQLGLHSSKHLPELLSIIESALSDPFIGEHLSVLTSAGDAMDTLLVNCWPCMSSKRAQEIIVTVGTAWLTLHDTVGIGPEGTLNQEVVDLAKESLERPAKKARLLLGRSDKDAEDKMEQIIAAEPRLAHMLYQNSRQHGCL